MLPLPSKLWLDLVLEGDIGHHSLLDQKLAMILQIRNIPTVFFMKEGAQPEKSVGAKEEEYFRAQINKLLSE